MRAACILFLICGAAFAGPPYGHSLHGPAFDSGPRLRAQLLAGQGRCHFPVTATADAQAFVDQAVAQFHGFHWYESERSFREALHRDPACVMALWGMAMVANGDVWFHAPVPRAKVLLTQALALRAHTRLTAREDAYLDALVKLLYAGGTRAGRFAFLDAMRAIVCAYPEDVEAKAFLLFELLKHDDLYKPEGSNWATRPSAAFLAEADGLADAVLKAAPDHPAHHYRIHIWDFHEPERALGSTDPIGPAAPRIAHMWHMAGHIHWRAGRFAEAAWQQEASARTDHRYFAEQRVMPFLNPNYLHNNDWLTEAWMRVGRLHDAVLLALNMIGLPRHPRFVSFATGSGVRGRDALMDVLAASERWDEVLRLVQSPALVPVPEMAEEIKRVRLRGLAHYRRGDAAALGADVRTLAEMTCPEGAPACVRSLPEAPDAAPASSPRVGVGADENRAAQENARRELSAYAAILAGERKRAHALLVGLEPHLQPPLDWEDRRLGLFTHQLAQAFADAGDRTRALALARRAAREAPGEVVPQAVLVELLARGGHGAELRGALAELGRIAGHADRDLPVLVRLARAGVAVPFAAGELHWLRPGLHPPLGELGPLSWQPLPAPDVPLVRDNRGKPLLLVLNLGRGCEHCNVQLAALEAAAPAFRAAGIAVRVVTPEAGAAVFRAFRAVDEFEDQLLHGTYLIDAPGKLRWEDVNAEPFLDFTFLLGEALRLLAARSPSR